jgi:hypothetical protein
VGAASRVPGALPLLGLFPFAFGIWFGVCLWRGRDPRKFLTIDEILAAYTGKPGPRA